MMSRLRVVVIALGLVGSLGTGVVGAVPPYDGTKIYATEEAFARSIQVYQDALSANPRDAAAAYWLGEAYWDASVLYRGDSIPYGAGYLDKSIASLERAVGIDDKYLAAWSLLAIAYHTRGAVPPLSGPPVPGDDEKSWAAAQKVLALSHDPAAANRGIPRAGAHNGEVAIRYLPLPDRSVKWNPADQLVVGDPGTKLLYRYPCSSLPPIARPALFLTKWEAFDRGYRPATVCPPR